VLVEARVAGAVRLDRERRGAGAAHVGQLERGGTALIGEDQRAQAGRADGSGDDACGHVASLVDDVRE
jgi:hypothetical protein